MSNPFAHRLERHAPRAVLAYTLVVLAVAVFLHPTPLYYVETDLVGEYIPAAHALAEGRLALEHYTYKGPGYPLILAGAGTLTGGDYFLAARIVSALAAGLSVWLGFLVVQSFAPLTVALFVLAASIANPTLLRYGIEAGTDTPALALALAATVLALRGRGAGAVLGAGLLAGFAMLVRGNCVFLLPAAALVLFTRPRRFAMLAAFAAGAAVPLGAWAAAHHAVSGTLPHDRNFLNVAYELYGRALPWDLFETRIGARFHSLWDVLAYDPLGAAGRIGFNFIAHRFHDFTGLLPAWIGIFALLGLPRMAGDRSARPALAFAMLCALTLATVFYGARFALYLLPFELTAAGYALHAVGRAVRARVAGPAAAHAPAWIAVGLVVASASSGAAALRSHLAEAPHEVRDAGAWLAANVPSGMRIVARKPHVAYHAGLTYVPFPRGGVAALLERARDERASYAFYSPLELVQRPECAVLSDSGVVLPGLDQVGYRSFADGRFFAVYRVTDVDPTPEELADALVPALERYASRRADDPAAQVFAAAQLVSIERPTEAIARLEPFVREHPDEGPALALLSTASFMAGDLERAYETCARALALGPETAWHHARLGAVRAAQGRTADARVHFERAVALEPAHVDHLRELGLSCAATGDYRAAAEAFERALRLAPADLGLRRYAIGAYMKMGDRARAAALIRDGRRAGLSVDRMMDPAATGRRETVLGP